MNMDTGNTFIALERGLKATRRGRPAPSVPQFSTQPWSPSSPHLYLDCRAMVNGVYEQAGGEAQLRGEIARPTHE